jgi:mRNA-degrading endonuclease toxin of MazEF toxin-antitoxin module
MNRGQIVEVDWPYSDLSGTKVRPALVVQADYLNGILDDTIFVKITGSRYGVPGTEVEIDPSTEPASRLRKICYASCKDILTRDQVLILRSVGTLSDALMRQIEDCLRQVMEIP